MTINIEEMKDLPALCRKILLTTHQQNVGGRSQPGSQLHSEEPSETGLHNYRI